MNLHLIHPTRNRKGDAPNFAHKPDSFEIEHTWFSKDFGRVKFRPIRIEDEALMVGFHETLSEENIYLRYFEHISLDTRTLHERLSRVCANTADSFAIVAETHSTPNNPAQLIAVGCLTTTENINKAAFALLVADNAQETELPKELLRRLLTIARAYRFRAVTGELLVADHDNLNLCRALGFDLQTVPEDGLVRVRCVL